MDSRDRKCDCCNKEWQLRVPYGRWSLFLCNDHALIYIGYKGNKVLKKRNGQVIRKRYCY